MEAFSIIPLFLVSLPIYIVITFVAFFIPGSLLLSAYKLSRFQYIVLAIMLGFVAWAWQGWVFGFLNIRWATYLYLFICIFVWMRNHTGRVFTRYLSRKAVQTVRIDYVAAGIVITGMINMLHNGFFNGYTTNGTIMFSGAIPSDYLWHAGLTHEIVENIPPFQPMMYATPVANYHIWGDVVAGELIRIFRLPLLRIVFQYFSVFLTLFLGLTSIVLSQILRFDRIAQRLRLFFLYFGGDLAPYIALVLGKGFSFKLGAMETGSAFLANVPRAYGFVVLFAGLSFLILWLWKKDLKSGIITSFMFASTWGFKANIGLAITAGLGALGCYGLIRKKFHLIVPLVLFLVLSVIAHVPLNQNAGGLIFTGFWRTRDFMMNGDLGLDRFELARLVFAQDNKWLKVLVFDIAFLALYMIVSFGTKLIGFAQSKGSLRIIPLELHIVLLTSIVSSLMLGMFFTQKSGGANSVYFTSNAFILLSIYAAISGAYWFRKMGLVFGTLFIIVIVALTIPRSLYESYVLYTWLLNGKYHIVDHEQRAFYTFVREKTDPDDIFLSGPQEMSFLANRPIFLGNGRALSILQAHQIDTSQREKVVNTLYTTYHATEAAQLLSNHHVDYLIDELPSTDSAQFTKQVYSSGLYSLWKVDHEELNKFLSQNSHEN